MKRSKKWRVGRSIAKKIEIGPKKRRSEEKNEKKSPGGGNILNAADRVLSTIKSIFSDLAAGAPP